MDTKEVLEVHIWDEYLMFAYLFGIADKVAKQLKNMYPENRKYIMQSSCCLNLKILMLLVSWGMYHLAVFLERKILHV